MEISPLESDIVKEVMKQVNFSETRTKFFGRPLYCRAIQELTPPKGSSAAGKPEVSVRSKIVEVTPNNDSTFDFVNMNPGHDTDSKAPASKLFNNGDHSTAETDSEGEYQFNNVTISNINHYKRERNSSGKGKKGKKFRK